MFSLRQTALCIFCAALSVTAAQLTAQDQQEGPSRQQRQEQRRQRRQEAGAVRREIVDGLETPRRERPAQREAGRQERRADRQAQMAVTGAQPAAAQASGGVRPTGEYKPVDNPVFKHKYTADPAPVVIGDTLWLITSHDHTDESGRPNRNYTMKDWCLFSTKDMKTWTEYPTPLSVDEFKWDGTHTAYAAQMIPRDGKYYLYISTNGNGIGVAVADKPEGPYISLLDPIAARYFA